MEAAGRLPSAGEELSFQQQIAGRVLPVEVISRPGEPATVWMDQSPPQTGAVVRDRAAVAAALGLTEGDLAADEPAQVVSTGAGHLLVPVRNRGAVDRAVPDVARLTRVLRQAGGEGCYLYSTDPVDPVGAVAYARFFNPTVGIAEDPATGTAAGPLVARLAATGKVPEQTIVIVEQGYALGRPSRIQVSASGPRIRVGGSGLVVAEGTLVT
jgi:PhzF family phenazine biosynthesis protein